jgi:hypothetical protein
MTRGPRGPFIASSDTPGPVQLTTDGEIATRKAVTGADTRLVQRLDAFPVSPVEGEIIVRVDLPNDPAYIYNADTATWDQLGITTYPTTPSFLRIVLLSR